MKIQIRQAVPDDAAGMAVLFFETVHAVNSRDYTPEQISAWAPRALTSDQMRQRQQGKYVWVGCRQEQIVGFAELDPDGHIDCLLPQRFSRLWSRFATDGPTVGKGSGMGVSVLVCRSQHHRPRVL